jgi:hypothetical protein
MQTAIIVTVALAAFVGLSFWWINRNSGGTPSSGGGTSGDPSQSTPIE